MSKSRIFSLAGVASLYMWILLPLGIMVLDVEILAVLVLALTVITIITFTRSHHPQNLWELELAPDASKVRMPTGRLSAAFGAYKEKFGLSRLIVDMANESRIQSEWVAYIVMSIAYVCILAYYVRVNPPHPQVSIDWVGVFLSTFGIVVVFGIVATYFYFFRIFSDYYTRWKLRKENGFARRRIRYVLESLESGKFHSTRGLKITRAELQKIIIDLDKLDELILGTKVRIRSSTIVGVVGLVSALLQLLALIAGSVVGLNVFSQWHIPIIITYSIGALVLLFMLPLYRGQHLLEWCQMESAMSELRDSVKQLSIQFVGKTQSDLLTKNFHLAWKPNMTRLER